MTYPEKLKPNSTENWDFNGNTLNIPKCVIQLDKWQGDPIKETFGGKPIVSLNNRPMFAELAIMNLFVMDGWDARWIETYGKGKNKPICLSEWKDDKYANQIHSPIQNKEITNLLALIAKNNSNTHSGCWDVIAWKGDQVLFAEAKRSKKDKIRPSQMNWLSAALKSNLRAENFLIAEWAFV